MPDVDGETPLTDAAAPGDDPSSRWVRAVRLGGRGRYAAAEALLRGLRTGPAVPQAIRAHAAVTRASHLRQVGAHGAAARLDAAAARLARPLVAGPYPAGADGGAGPGPAGAGGGVADPAGTGPVAAYGDALTGLAADAIGRWDAGSARRLLVRAAPWCGVDPGSPTPVSGVSDPVAAGGPSRTAVRWFWVRAETALLAGDPVTAARASGAAVRLAADLGSARHLLKSRLVDAVARGAAAPRPAVVERATREQASGEQATGERTSGEQAVGEQAVGEQAVGEQAAGERAAAGDPVVAELDAIAAEAAGAGLLPLRWPALLAAADREPPVVAGPAEPPGPPGRHADRSRLSTVSRQTVADGRRHAAYVTLNAIYLHSDPLARRAMRESAWLPGPGAVPY